MLARGGGKWVALVCVFPFLSLLHSPVAAALAALLPVGVAAFFRDPDRNPDGDGVVSSADGKVTVIREEDGRLRLGVFMNLYDVHVNRSPVGGTVEERVHSPGAHRPAFTKESDRNERVETRVGDFVVVQIAGAFARRITSYVGEGEAVERGDRIGLIAFGSRVDVLFPPSYDTGDLYVEKGDRVRAGETVLAPCKSER